MNEDEFALRDTIDDMYWQGVHDMAEFLSGYMEYPDLYNNPEKLIEMFTEAKVRC